MDYQPLDIGQLQAKLQQSGMSWTAGVTTLSDLSLQEKRVRLGAEPPPGEATLQEREQVSRANFLAGIAVRSISAPPAYDLRDVGGKNFITPVTNQLNCGSCVSFGSVATVEGTLRVKHNNPNLPINLSEAHLFYCHAKSQGRNCGNGWWVDPALEAFKTIGVVDEACYPYTPGDQNCGVCSDWKTRVTKIAAWSKLSTAADMKTWLSTKGPLAACFSVYEDFYAYRNGIYRHTSGDLLGGHCVCTVGYDDANGYWICKNSWGSNWGENGFFRIAYGECGLDYVMWDVEVDAATDNWLKKALITGLWSVNQDRNAAAYIEGTGWRKVSAETDSVFESMLTLLASAKVSKSPVNLRIENDVIKEIYVF